jgi:hypothetical protein
MNDFLLKCCVVEQECKINVSRRSPLFSKPPPIKKAMLRIAPTNIHSELGLTGNDYS